MTPASGIKRVVLATSDLGGFALLRSALISAIVERRHKVVVMAPEGRGAVNHLEALGATVVVTPFAATGFNPFASFRLTRELSGHLKACAPHALAFCDTASAVSLHPAARRAEIENLIAMFGAAPLIAASDSPTQNKALKALCDDLKGVVVDTPEERRALLASNCFETPIPVAVVPASGIDVRKHLAADLPALKDGFVFALIAAADDGGARDTFKAAADRLAQRSTAASFTIADDADLDARDDAIRSAHVVVHASSRDGLAPGLLKALATGRPVITTDVAGARDTVDERVNGCRVAPGDPIALADAMASFLKRTDLVPAMARAARLKAERRYDIAEVNRITLDALVQLP